MSIVDQARDAARRLLLLDECQIVELGEEVYDPNTGTYTVPETVVYPPPIATGDATVDAGKCNLTPFKGAGELDEQLGGESVVTRDFQLTLPWNAPRIRKQMVVTMTSSRDTGLVGRKFRVNHEGGETFQTARRLIVEAIDTSEAP